MEKSTWEEFLINNSDIGIIEHLREERSEYFTVQFDEATGYEIHFQEHNLVIKRFDRHGYTIEMNGILWEKVELHDGDDMYTVVIRKYKEFLKRLDRYLDLARSKNEVVVCRSWDRIWYIERGVDDKIVSMNVMHGTSNEDVLRFINNEVGYEYCKPNEKLFKFYYVCMERKLFSDLDPMDRLNEIASLYFAIDQAEIFTSTK